MRNAVMISSVLAGLMLVGGSSTSGNSDRELRELAERVSKLEKQANEFERDLARLEKSLSNLPKPTPSTSWDLSDQMAELQRAVAALDTSHSHNTKTIAAMSKELKAVADQAAARTLLLAEWFDEYHPRGSGSRYHRDQVEREK